MQTKKIKRFSAGFLILMHVATMPALAAVCGSSSSLGTVLSVIDDGKIEVGSGGCNVRFYGVTTVGTESGKYVEPEAGKCYSYGANGVKTTTPVTASGVSASARTLDAWQESSSDFNVEIATESSVSYGVPTLASWCSVSPPPSWCYQSPTVNTPADGDYPMTSGSRTVVLNKAGKVYTLPGGDYGKINFSKAESGYKLVFSGPVRIKSLSVSNNVAVVFAPDNKALVPSQNFIDEFSLASATSMSINGSGLATLNILGKNVSTGTVSGWSIGSNVCINYLDCNPGQEKTAENMAMQVPERLQINIYNGNLVTQGSFAVAAGIYVANGAANFSNGTPVTVVGEVLARSVTLQNNNGTQLYYKSTGTTTLKASAYSLTPPIANTVTRAGDFVYRAMQSDYRSDGKTPGTSGDLKAFALKADSSQEQTATWSAAEVVAGKMLATTRAEKLRTEKTDWNSQATHFETLSDTPSGETLAQACAINPTRSQCRLTSGDPRDPDSMVGMPWRVAPLIVGDSILFATDDGILYSVDKANGNLNWGWIPRQVLALSQSGLTSTPQSLMQGKHPWGQIALAQMLEDVTAEDGSITKKSKSYLTGTALGGQLHFSIEVGNDGKSLKRIVWLDYRAGEYSPGSSAANWPGVAGRPYGGQAPVQAASGTNKVAYVVGGKLVTRSINAAVTVTPVAFSVAGGEAAVVAPAPTSTLLYMDDNAIYFGASNGKVYKTSSAGALEIGSDSVDKVSTGDSGAVWFLNGVRIASASGNGLTLVAQTERLVTAMRLFNDKWSFSWQTGFNADHTSYSSPASNPKINVEAGDKAYLSAGFTIKAGKIFLFYTKAPDECNITAWSFGPLSLDDGTSSLANTLFRFVAMGALDNEIGGGESTGASSTTFDNKDGLLAGSGGAATGGAGKPDTAFINPPVGGYKERLNWRELTNFF